MELFELPAHTLVGTDTTNGLGYYEFTEVPPGSYLLMAYRDGFVADSAFVTISDRDTTISFYLRNDVIKEGIVPESYALLSVEPNPFNSACRITAMGPVEIYDISGKLVSEVGGDAEKSGFSLVWDTRENLGEKLPSGVYFAVVRSSAGEITVRRRLFLVR